MEEKWICSCGQENDANFCIKCGSPKPAAPESAEPAPADNTWVCSCGAVNDGKFCVHCGAPKPDPAAPVPPKAVASQTAPPKKAAPAAKKKKNPRLLIGIIAAAVVVVAAIVVVLILFVFNNREKLYDNETGNYSVIIPAGYKTTDYDNGIVAKSKDAALFVNYVETAPREDLLIYDWYDFLRYEYKDIMSEELYDALGVYDVEDDILDVSSYGDGDFNSYELKMVCEDGETATGELHLADTDTLGCYLVCYYMKDNVSEKKAEKIREDFADFFDSFEVHGAPNIPAYEIVDMSEYSLGHFAVRSELVGDVDVGVRSCWITAPEGNEEVMIEIVFANSVLEIFSWEGITDGQIESSTSDKITDKGRYELDVFLADYRDKNNNKRAYGIYGSFADIKDPAIIAIEYNVSADMKEWAENVCQDIIWSWHMY